MLGEQPVIETDQAFEYTSTTVIQDPSGKMEGAYTFRTAAGKFVEVPIPSFELLYPIIIH